MPNPATHSQEQSLIGDDRLIWDTMMSVYNFPALTAADDLGIFPFLAHQPATAQDVAVMSGISLRGTEALLGMLAALGFLSHRGGKFQITDVSRNFLLPASPFYWGGMLRFMRDIAFTGPVLKDGLLNDKPKAYDGQDMWDTHEVDPEQARVFTSAIHSRSVGLARAVAECGDFRDVRRLLDVAGGSGVFSATLAARYPDLHCTVLELPVVCTLVAEYTPDDVKGRVGTLAIDMFGDHWPSDVDGVLFSNIFHDWDDERCRQLSAKSFACLPAGGRLYVSEILLSDSRDGPLSAAAGSMHMMFFTEGKQRSVAEFEAILGECGYVDISVAPTFGYFSLLTARKP